MKWFHLTSVLVCVLASSFQSGIEAKSFKDVARKVILDLKTANKAIKTTDDAIKLFSEMLDNILPWKTFNETLAELEKYKHEYSEQSASLIGDIKQLMREGVNSYYHASEYIFGWCNEATPLLNKYVRLFNEHTPTVVFTQRDLLVETLTKGVAEMKSAQDAIAYSSSSFNGATGKLTTLNSRFQVEFTEKSEYYETKVTHIRVGAYVGTALLGPLALGIAAAVVELKYVPELKEKMTEIQTFYDHLKLKVGDAFKDVDTTKNMLNIEIIEIGDLKVETKEARAFLDLDHLPELRESLMKPAESLIKNCKIYRQKHAEKAHDAK